MCLQCSVVSRTKCATTQHTSKSTPSWWTSATSKTMVRSCSFSAKTSFHALLSTNASPKWPWRQASNLLKPMFKFGKTTLCSRGCLTRCLSTLTVTTWRTKAWSSWEWSVSRATTNYCSSPSKFNCGKLSSRSYPIAGMEKLWTKTSCAFASKVLLTRGCR
jgi:hypothetical protein